MNSKILIWSFFFICLLSGPAAGADIGESADKPKADSPLLRKTIFGLGLHDTGPISDKQESGVDPNWELQFNPPGWKWWRWIGSPYTIVGVMANFSGATSQVYAAFNYEVSLSNKYTDPWTFNLTKYLFVSVALGPAIHNGPLKKNEAHCKQTDDCGFGHRIVPRLFGEIGAYFLKNQGVSVFVDHMSGAAAFGASQNEGVDHIGIRYHYIFKTNL
jgi:hypothetical protein